MSRVHRAYSNEYPSVTTILGVLRKPGLEHWFKMNSLKFITNATNKGKTIGTQTHEAIEDYINTGKAKVESEYPDEVINALNSFMLFKKENSQFELKLSEKALVHETYKYNGTIDAPNPPDLLDWKTSECKKLDKPPIYDEWKYQVSAYVHLWNHNNPDRLIDKAHIVAIAKDKVAYNLYTIYEEEINDLFNQVFLPCLNILKYQKERHFYGKPVAVNS